MKKKKVFKIIAILFFVITVIFLVYNLIFYKITGNTQIHVLMNDIYYTGNDITATVKVHSKAHNGQYTIKSTVKVSLYDSEDKKVDGLKEEKYESDDLDVVKVAYKVPEDLKPGVYNLKFKIKSEDGYDVIEKGFVIKELLNHNLIISLDKGIYKPGDEVQFRGMLLLKKDNTPEEKDVTVSIYDGNENKVYTETKKTSDYGILSGAFKLANEVNSGTYKIVFSLDNEEFSKNFTVNPYVTPKFGVAISANKEVVKVDEESTITVDSKYFFGEPVKNANVEIFCDNGITNNGVTNEEGKYEFKFAPNSEGVHLIQVKVVDESNYMVEEDYRISCSNDAFRVELLPENKDIVLGVNNDVYLFTKKVDGTPVKTYNEVTIGNLTRQVITDEKGIGMFSLSTSDVSKIKEGQTSVTINSENMDGEKVRKNESIDVVKNNDVLIKTDKIKYNQGDDITVSLNSKYDSNYTELYVVKDSKVLKTISTDQNEVTFNLDDEFGLINIFTLSNDGKSFKNKRTVFVKPSKTLTVDIDTDKEVYSPGDSLKLELELKDENGNKADGAVLVSILDEAVQNLAVNDLNIDNLMLALSDIQLADGIDLASVYATILDSKNDTMLMGLLLKQEVSISGKKDESFDTRYEMFEYKEKFEIAKKIIIVYLILLICFKFRKSLKNIVAEIGTLIACGINSIVVISIIYQFVNRTNLDLIDIDSAVALGLIVTVILYITLLVNHKKIFWMNALYFVIIPLLLTIIAYMLFDYYDGVCRNTCNINWFEIIALVFLCMALSIIVITLVKNREKILEEDKNFYLKIASSLTICALYVVPVYFFSTDEEHIIFAIALNWILANIFLVVDLKKHISGVKKREDKKEDSFIKIDKNAVIAFVILLVLAGLQLMRSWSMDLDRSYDIETIDETPRIYNTSETGFNTKFSVSDDSNAGGMTSFNQTIMASDAANVSSPTISGFDTIFSSNSSNNVDRNSRKTESNLSIDLDEKFTTEDENIRNVFLESLCFIPELVTDNGKASTEIKLSDNITTWQIQAVANTKDGRIGFGTNNFKVFKDFFVDFSLPTNAVVGDKISIPVTVYNYTDKELSVELSVKEESWFLLGEYDKTVIVNSKGTNMVYIPIEILAHGENKFRVDAKAESEKDIIEKTMEVKPNGVEIYKVVNSGTFEKDMNLDIILNEKYIEDTESLKVKLYPSTMTAVIENLDNIFKMPTGCFEQTSSSLYPDVVALRYINENKIDNQAIKDKAMGYINSGYQRLLTFETSKKDGGFSLYGNDPAEIVLTAYGVMELKDVSTVYEVDENVITRMKEYIFKNQKSNGSFKINDESSYFSTHTVSNCDEFTLNAYITWTLSETFPEDSRLNKSVEYIENNLDKAKDDYTLALIANIFANTNNKNTQKVLNKLLDNVKKADDKCYFESETCDYWGSRGKTQNIQTTALTSLALSKEGAEAKTNKALVDYIISARDPNGTWNSTQATILSLKALVGYSEKAKISEQDIIVELNGDKQSIHIDKNNLDVYEVNFDSLEKENHLNLNSKNGELYYEVIEHYYKTYEEFEKENKKLAVESQITEEVNVNDNVVQKIQIVNNNEKSISNLMVKISVPQGCSVREESLSKLVTLGYIEKYEYNYNNINLYLRNFDRTVGVTLNIEYIANYPETVTGGMVRAYDYYNPEIEGYSMPSVLTVR